MTPRRNIPRPRPADRTATQEQYDAEMRLRAAAERSAAVMVCDAAITAGCGGPGCGDGHGQHVAGIVQALRALGLMPDPEGSMTGKYHWGAARSPKGDMT